MEASDRDILNGEVYFCFRSQKSQKYGKCNKRQNRQYRKVNKILNKLSSSKKVITETKIQFQRYS